MKESPKCLRCGGSLHRARLIDWDEMIQARCEKCGAAMNIIFTTLDARDRIMEQCNGAT